MLRGGCESKTVMERIVGNSVTDDYCKHAQRKVMN